MIHRHLALVGRLFLEGPYTLVPRDASSASSLLGVATLSGQVWLCILGGFFSLATFLLFQGRRDFRGAGYILFRHLAPDGVRAELPEFMRVPSHYAHTCISTVGATHGDDLSWLRNALLTTPQVSSMGLPWGLQALRECSWNPPVKKGPRRA